MEFKKIQLNGFKSFADKTNFLIEEGLTGIVGPNGCGKSNIVESLRWVMGETSAKSMRGSGMEDVIFSGTSNKASKNIAEVSIDLDNKNNEGPVQYRELDQINVRRKIEKDKGSKFYINDKEVRARDAQMFFADLSTGAHSPSMISQGRIGSLVTAKPTDRRAILEEAAGISGLHVRRHEAELRLANCFSCCLLSSSALLRLFSAAPNLNSASCLLTCKPEIPAASSKIALRSVGFAVTKEPIRP